VPSPLADARTIAIILPSWVGDTVMATPVLRAVRTHLPNAKLIGVMRPGLDEVLRGSPWLDQLIVRNFKGVAGPWRIAGAIRAAGADAVLLLPNSFRSALAARLSGARIRIGYSRDARGWLLTHTTGTDPVSGPPNAPISAVEYYARLAEYALGFASIDRRIELRCTEDDLASAEYLLRDVARPFIVLNPGANRPDKRWPFERFARVAHELAASHRVSVVITGSPNELSILDAVASAARTPIINLTKRGITLGSLKAVLKQAALLITNDTGPRHMAAALGTPVIALFGPTDHRWTTLPDSQGRERILLADPFLPEEMVADNEPSRCAIDRIPVSDVVVAARSMLDAGRIGSTVS
jgi:heptosyltransferase-2